MTDPTLRIGTALRNAAIADGKLRYLLEPIPVAPGPEGGANQKVIYDDFVMEAGAI